MPKSNADSGKVKMTVRLNSESKPKSASGNFEGHSKGSTKYNARKATP